MTDDNDIEPEEEAPAGSSGPLAGERLAAARREQQITVDEVAKELHLDEPKVRALERNEFEVLGAPVFAKGHLRKYAQLVGVPIEDVLADYYTLNRSPGLPPVVAAVRRPPSELSPVPWVAVFVAVLLVAAAYWYFVVRDSGSPAVGRGTPATVVAPPADSADATDSVADNDNDEAAATVDEPAPPDPLDDIEESAAEVQPAAEPLPVTDGALRLTLQFSGDCWTEITDAGGRQLFFDLGQEGRVASVTGQPPLAVLFGNADNVSLRVNGEPYDIGRANRRGQTARLTIRSQE